MRLPASCCTPIWLVLASTAVAQIVRPSNNSQDLYPIATSPRFLLNGTQFPNLPAIGIAPVGDYARMSHNAFVNVEVDGILVNVDASNVNDVGRGDRNLFAYVSCDPEAYTGNLDASYVFRLAVNRPRANIVILYSETSDHCAVSGLNSLPAINGILTTTEAMAANMLADLGLTYDSEGDATILPDLNSYTNSSNSAFSSGFGSSPTTAVAMIILYSITGIITALFVVIIITGAIRAHRHPERYGPRTIIGGRGRQSRARGIARAMLDTLPIVKFGDKLEPHAAAKDPTAADVEMNNTHNPEQPAREAGTTANDTTADPEHPDHDPTVTGAVQRDGTDEEGQLGCSICTEDFNKGEEVRVLPCSHKFHPDCVDPWLLNVSGTCPLCRIDLRPQPEEAEASATADGNGALPPPLGGRRSSTVNVTRDENGPSSLRRDTITQLRRLAAGSNDDRMAALRRYRLERRPIGDTTRQDESERRGLASRLRERFRVRTERRETMAEVDFSRRGTFGGPVRGG